MDTRSMNLPEGFVLEDEEPTGLSNLPEGFVLEEEEPKDVGTLQQMKSSGQPLTREQERILWEADEAKPLTQKASEAVSTFVPTAWNIAKQLGTGAGEFIYKGVLKPIDTISQSPEEAEKTLKEAGNVWRSAVHGVAQDVQETADAGVRFAMFGSSITDKLLGKSDEERFERYMLRNANREFAQKVYEDNPDAAARLMAENPMLQGLAYAAAIAQGGTEEEAQMAKQAYEQLVKESGLTKDEINENIALLGEVISPLSLPGTNTVTKFLNKGTSKVLQKTGELTLRGVAPIAKGVEKTAIGVEKLVEGAEKLSRKIGEYTVGDPDTLLKTSTTTALAPAKIPAKMTRGIARTVADVASEAGAIGGPAGRRGLFERAGRSATAGDLTKKLFGPESLGGKGRARVADWTVRQANAIAQPAVNGAVLNVALGLPDIETGTDLGYIAGVGAGIGAYGGARLPERAYALIDPTTSLAQKIDAVLTPDPEGFRRDQDADIKRFLATADTSLLDSINDLSNLDNIKSALDVKIKNLEGRKTAQIRDEDAKRIQAEIDNLKNQRKALDKSTPQTEAEIKRQIQLSFADAMDLAKTTGAAAGLNNIQVKVLRPDQMEQFYRDLYGKTLSDAESVIQQLLGNPNMTPQEKQMFDMADQTVKAFLADVAGASTARGFAISESSTRPEHLRYENQKGATVVINGDLVTQMGRDGLNLARVINHEIQHGLSNFEEVRQMLAPLRRQLFDQKIQNPDGTFEVVSKGSISDAQLDAYALQYAAAMDASGGASFLGQFANQDQLRAYMKEEVLSELAGLSGASHGNLRGALDSTGRQVVDWLEVKSQNGALKKIKDALRRFGIVVDDQGQFSSVLGAELTPEALAAMRQYQRKLRDLNESMVYNSDPRKDAPEITLTQIATNRALQERYKYSDFFEQQQVVVLTTPDGRTQEVVVPPGAKVDKFVSDYRFQGGRLVDLDGNPVSLGPDIPIFQTAMPDGTAVTIDTRIARNADGSPRILSPRETKRRAKQRTEAIRKAIDEAPDDQSGVRLEDMGNGNYRGTLSPAQIDAINALPNDLVAPSLKRKIAFFNDILGRKDGTIAEIEYQAALRDGKYRAIQPQIRTEIPIGFQFSKDGNFLMTTMSVSRMHDKANAWAAKRPKNLRLWGGDMTKFWDSVRQYLTNHKAGLQGHIGLHPDPEIAMQMKNRINDLFNVYRKETREANPERTTLPKRRGQDSRDVVIRARRMDRINSYDETALPKMPFQYELAVQNYLPAENPFAEYQSAEQFAQAMEVDPELVQRAIGGDIEPLELQLHEQDLLHPAEYVDVRDGQLRVRSMFDPTQNVFIPGESESDTPEVIGRAKRLSSELDEMYAAGGTDLRISEYESELEQIYQQLESQAQERESETYDFEESPETTEVDMMNTPTEAVLAAVDSYNAGQADNESQTLAQHIRFFVGSSGALQIPENVTDQQIEAAANDVVQYRESLKNRIRSGTAFSNAIVAPAGIQYLPAFHGSPYDFDKFQINKIGSGEGAQAYGYGLYFAGLRDVGEKYRKKLSFIKNSQFGTLYKVDLDVNDKDLLDWDGSNLKNPDDLESGKINSFISKYLLGWQDIKSIDDFEYNLKIAEQALAYGGETGFYNLAMDDARKNNLQDVVDYWASVYLNSAATGEYIYSRLIEALGTPQKASEYLLNSLDIKGIRYLDGMSRGAGEGTHNYVIFDENLIKVLEKNDQPVGPITQFMPAENIRDQVIDAYFNEFLKDSPFDDSVRVEKQGPQYTREEFREAYNNGEIDQFDFEPGIRRQVASQFPGYFGQETQFSNATVTSPGVQFLPAYHGTKTRIPAEEGFQLKYVGTGQGKQAWGWGLYFATNPKVVERSYPSQFRYKVDLDLNPEDALDYDAPIDPRLLESAQQLSAEVGAELTTNGDYYEALSDKLGTPKDASMELLSMGIPAIRYLDGRSRSPKVAPEDKTYNYVVFDESKIKILDETDTQAGPVTQFMPAVQAVPERFTGTGEKGEDRRGRYVAPPEFWTRFDIGEFEKGGKFFDMETGEDITDKTYATGTIDVTGKRPSLISDTIIDEMPEEKGRTWKTNLFRKSAVWEWISENPPKVAAIGSKEKPDPVLISVEGGKDHFYTLKAEFPNGVQLARYPDEGSEPRLRPTKKGQIQLGNVIGRIKTKSKEHPVYDTITIGTKFMPAESDAEYLRLAQNPEQNREQLQAMVDEAARRAGYDITEMYHGTTGDFNIFDPSKDSEKRENGDLGSGFYFTPDKNLASDYADWATEINEGKTAPRIIRANLKAENTYYIDPKIDKPWEMNIEERDKWVESLKNKGYDSIESKDGKEFVVFDNTQIKSADPVTYDNEGNIIPLSQRFQTTSPDIRFMPAEQESPEGMQGVQPPKLYPRTTEIIRPLQGVEPPVAATPAEQPAPAEPETPEPPTLPKKVEKTMKADAGDFSVVIGGKPGKYGFGYTTVTELQPQLELSEQRKKDLLETLTPRNEELNKKRDALLETGNLWWENDDLRNKAIKTDKDRKRMQAIDQFLQEFMSKEDKEFTIDDAIQVAQVDRLTKRINELQRGMTPPPFKFPADREVALKSLQSTVATIFKTKKFKDFIETATGVQGIQFDNILGTWKFDPEPSYVFSAPGMTWEQSQIVTKWLSFLMTQDAGIAWKPSIGLTEGVDSIYLVHDKKLTEDQILKAFRKAKEVGIDGLSLTVDGKGIKAANFDGIKDFDEKLIEIQKASNIKNIHDTFVDSFYYDTTSDFTAEDGSTRMPDWLKGDLINEKNTQDQQGGITGEKGAIGDNAPTGGLSVLLRRGIDSVLIPYAKALAGEGFTFDPDRFAERYGLGQQVADYIREQLYPTTGLSRSVTPILEGTERFVVPESFYTKEGKLKTSVNDLLYALQRRSADDGFIAPGDYSNRAGQIISETIVDEVMGHIERARQNPDAPNAIGWYDAALKRMKQEYAKYFPFLNRGSKDYNADKEFVFDAVLGITSQGNNVFENGKMAARIQFLLENGKSIPEIVEESSGTLYGTFGGETRAIENNLKKLDELLKNNDTQTLDKIFRKKMTVSEWNAYLKKNKNLYFKGEPLSVDGQANQMVTGFSVFGPKIGSFINNLHGDYSTLTADLWFTRTWNRILGNVFQHASLKEAKQYDAFRKALIEQYRKNDSETYRREFKPLVKKVDSEGKDVLFDYFNETELEGLSENEFGELINDPQKMLDLATALEDRYRKGQYKTKSDLRRAAKNWVENRSDPVAAPRTDLERDFQQTVMEIAQKKLRRKGIDISIADMQAALWYNEKELFGLYGAQVSGTEPADYADSAENVSELMNYGTLFQLERMVEQEDGTKKKETIRLVPYDTELGLTKIKNAKTPEEYSKLVAARKKEKEDEKKAEKKIEKAELKVEKKKQELAQVDPTDEKAKQKAEAALAKAQQLLADLKPPVPIPVAPLTGIQSPVK